MSAARKANTPTLTRDQIVSAAIAVVDREGLEALSMRKLAAELGVGPMSLYYHVPDKSALYDLILDAIMGEADLSGDDPSEPVGDRLVRIAYSLRDALLTHPHAATLAMSRSLRTPEQLRPVEAMLGIMFDAGLSPADSIAAVDVIGQFTFGTTMAYASHLTDSEYHDDERDADLSAITPDAFPNISRLLAETEYRGWDAEFDEGVRALVKGLVLDRLKP